MNKQPLVLMTIASLLFACSDKQPSTRVVGKEEGPDIKGLSHEQLMAIYGECTQYGRIDDPKVPYAPRYCAAIQSAHLSEGYAAPGPSRVDPTINQIH